MKKEFEHDFFRKVGAGMGLGPTCSIIDGNAPIREVKNMDGREVMKAKKEIPICPKCGSKEIRARIKTGELWCRRCGYIGKKEEFYKQEEIK